MTSLDCFYYILIPNLKCRYLLIERVLTPYHLRKKVLFLSLESISGLRRSLVGGGWVGGWVGGQTNYRVCSRTRKGEFWYGSVMDMLGGRLGSRPGLVLVLALDNLYIHWSLLLLSQALLTTDL